ncbi:MAG TPA: hypothetical protein VFU45_07140 [Gemmatimonadales bacterium]|nr:hypothetical protein [Gemmatimonadales bacterium]
MSDPASLRRIYRLWRTSAILCGLGAVEFALLAWQRGVAWIAAAAVPLVAVSIFATRRAARARRSWGIR